MSNIPRPIGSNEYGTTMLLCGTHAVLEMIKFETISFKILSLNI